PPTLSERCHRSLARRRVAIDRRAVFVLAVGQSPWPWRAHGRGGGLHDAADDYALPYTVRLIAIQNDSGLLWGRCPSRGGQNASHPRPFLDALGVAQDKEARQKAGKRVRHDPA